MPFPLSTHPAPQLPESAFNKGPVALVAAHPGHEARIYGWLGRLRPTVYVLTDGSGHGDRGRLASSTTLLRRAEAAPGKIFGRLTDREAYRWILTHRVDAVLDLVHELAAQLVAGRVRHVISDAVEGMNPVHDLCFVVTSAAVRIARRDLGTSISHHDFLLEAAPDGRDHESPLVLQLSDRQLDEKLDAALAYRELRFEVERALSLHGREAFRKEVLYPVAEPVDLVARVGDPPLYESFGARRVADGIYSEVLEFRRHFEPLVSSLLAELFAASTSADSTSADTTSAEPKPEKSAPCASC